MVRHVLLWPIHHAKHGYSARPDKPNHQDGSQEQKDDIQNTRVVPLYPLSDRCNIPIRGNETKRLEKKLDHVACCCHGHVERQQNKAHDAPAVIFAINIQYGQDDQIGKDKADHATKANAAPP